MSLLKMCFIFISIILILSPLSLYTQAVWGPKPDGVTMRGQLLYKLRDRIDAIGNGHVFALSLNEKNIIGYSSTNYGHRLAEGGVWEIRNLPLNEEIILVGFHPSVKRLAWVRTLNTGNNRHINIGENKATMPILNPSPSDAYGISGILQLLFIAGWIAEVYEANQYYRFIDELTEYLISEYDNMSEKERERANRLEHHRLVLSPCKLASQVEADRNALTCEIRINGKKLEALIISNKKVYDANVSIYNSPFEWKDGDYLVSDVRGLGRTINMRRNISGYKIMARSIYVNGVLSGSVTILSEPNIYIGMSGVGITTEEIEYLIETVPIDVILYEYEQNQQRR